MFAYCSLLQQEYFFHSFNIFCFTGWSNILAFRRSLDPLPVFCRCLDVWNGSLGVMADTWVAHLQIYNLSLRTQLLADLQIICFDWSLSPLFFWFTCTALVHTTHTSPKNSLHVKRFGETTHSVQFLIWKLLLDFIVWGHLSIFCALIFYLLNNTLINQEQK